MLKDTNFSLCISNIVCLLYYLKSYHVSLPHAFFIEQSTGMALLMEWLRRWELLDFLVINGDEKGEMSGHVSLIVGTIHWHANKL